jgi:hypothetical protein
VVISFLLFHISPKLEDAFLKACMNVYIKNKTTKTNQPNKALCPKPQDRKTLSDAEAQMSILNWIEAMGGTN